MTRLLHISDLHFGAVNDRLLDPLVALSAELRPDAVVISGDLTQRARPDQFRAAAAYLARFGVPTLAVPGNHDAPLYNLPVRIFHPFGRYRALIHDAREPVLTLPGAVVAGINTANPRVWKSGHLRPASAQALARAFGATPAGHVRIAVMHHAPVRAADGAPADIAHPARVLADLVRAGTDIVLSGHTHMPHFGAADTEAGILFLQVGTAISTRLKTAWNDVSLIEITADSVRVQPFLADATYHFEPGAVQHFHRKIGCWQQAVSPRDLAAQ